MAKITPPQNVPSELEQPYYAALMMPSAHPGGEQVKRRYPWRLPHMQGNGLYTRDPKMGAGVTDDMWAQRSIFKQACNCFNLQTKTAYAEPPPTGPRSRAWWYEESLGSDMYYYNYFMQQTINYLIATGTPPWCMLDGIGDSFTFSGAPDMNFNDIGFLAISWAGQGIETYIKKPAAVLSIHIKVVATEDPDGFDAPNNLWVRAVEDNWTEETLTYNNRPAYTNDLGVIKLTAAFPKWYSFTVPAQTKAISLLVNPGAGRVTILPHEEGGIYWT